MPSPRRGFAYEFYSTVTSRLDGRIFQVSPTIISGDFQISKDGGAFVNLANIPTVTPSGTQSIHFSLTATEMEADKILIMGVDSGDEWSDFETFIDIDAFNIDAIANISLNLATVQLELDGSRTITIFEDDNVTEIAVVSVSADGFTRTRIS